jgi:hypothetical protein
MDFKAAGGVGPAVKGLALLLVGPAFQLVSKQLSGRTNDGLPLGPQLVGQCGADGLVLRVAATIEALAPWSDHRPKEE